MSVKIFPHIKPSSALDIETKINEEIELTGDELQAVVKRALRDYILAKQKRIERKQKKNEKARESLMRRFKRQEMEFKKEMEKLK